MWCFCRLKLRQQAAGGGKPTNQKPAHLPELCLSVRLEKSGQIFSFLQNRFSVILNIILSVFCLSANPSLCLSRLLEESFIYKKSVGCSFKKDRNFISWTTKNVVAKIFFFFFLIHEPWTKIRNWLNNFTSGFIAGRSRWGYTVSAS